MRTFFININLFSSTFQPVIEMFKDMKLWKFMVDDIS